MAVAVDRALSATRSAIDFVCSASHDRPPGSVKLVWTNARRRLTTSARMILLQQSFLGEVDRDIACAAAVLQRDKAVIGQRTVQRQATDRTNEVDVTAIRTLIGKQVQHARRGSEGGMGDICRLQQLHDSRGTEERLIGGSADGAVEIGGVFNIEHAGSDVEADATIHGVDSHSVICGLDEHHPRAAEMGANVENVVVISPKRQIAAQCDVISVIGGCDGYLALINERTLST